MNFVCYQTERDKERERVGKIEDTKRLSNRVYCIYITKKESKR